MGSVESILAWATAIGSAITAVATLALVYVAWVTLSGAREQLVMLREDSDRATRPYVYLDVVPGLHGPGHWDLAIVNVGQSSAKEIRVDVGRLTPVNSEDHIAERLSAFLDVPFSLPPSAKRRVLWRSEPEDDDSSAEAGAPPNVMATVEYRDELGRAYADQYSLAVDLYGAVSPAPTKGPTAIGKGKQLDNIERALRTLNTHVGELRR